MRSKVLGLAALTAVTSGCATNPGSWNPAHIAQEPHIYAGAAIGQSKYDDDKADQDANLQASLGVPIISSTSTLDNTKTGFGAVLGYRLAPFFGTEIAYYRFGKEQYNANLVGTVQGANVPITASFSAKTSAVGVSGLAFLPIRQNWEVFARGGLLLASTDLDTAVSAQGQTNAASGSADSSDFFVGAGGSYYYNDQWEFRVEYQRFLDVGNSDTGEVDINLVGVQVLYSIF
jgi:opacity protein-like surface antigen